MFKVNISESVYNVIFNEVKKRLQKEYNKESKLYHDVITQFYVKLLNISESLKFNPYAYPELIPGYRYILIYPINLIYKIEADEIWIIDGITQNRWKEAYQSYTKNTTQA